MKRIAIFCFITDIWNFLVKGSLPIRIFFDIEQRALSSEHSIERERYSRCAAFNLEAAVLKAYFRVTSNYFSLMLTKWFDKHTSISPSMVEYGYKRSRHLRQKVLQRLLNRDDFLRSNERGRSQSRGHLSLVESPCRQPTISQSSI